MEERESSRTSGGVGGECRGEHEILERELLLEPSRDCWEDDDTEYVSLERCGRVGLTKRAFWYLVVEMEVEVSLLSLRSDTFLPDASSPYMARGRSPLELLSAQSLPPSVYTLLAGNGLSFSRPQRPCHRPSTANACCYWWSVPLAGPIRGWSDSPHSLSLTRTHAHTQARDNCENKGLTSKKKKKSKMIGKGDGKARLICKSQTHPANPAPFELGGPATGGGREGQGVWFWAAAMLGSRGRVRLPISLLDSLNPISYLEYPGKVRY